MPFGEYQYTVDDKGRVIIPPTFRNFVEDGMVITRGMEGCLYIFPIAKWRGIEEELSTLPVTDPSSRKFTRFFYSGAAQAKLDNAGRITIPQTLRGFADVASTVIVAGAPNRLEIWDEARWLSDLAEIQNDPPRPDLLSELVG